jgi:hypothetical protein
MKAATEGNVVTPCAKQRTPATRITQSKPAQDTENSKSDKNLHPKDPQIAQIPGISLMPSRTT